MSYDAIYNGTRQALRCDAERAIRDAVDTQIQGLSQAIIIIKDEYQITAIEQRRPSVIFRPSLTIDGNGWCALYGDNLQDGVAGYGATPDAAMRSFDEAWGATLKRNSDNALDEICPVPPFPSVRP